MQESNAFRMDAIEAPDVSVVTHGYAPRSLPLPSETGLA